MQVSELMTREVQTIAPDDTIQAAARIMAEIDAGVLPVAEGEKLVGMITDRDIAIRAVAQGQGPDSRVSDVMSDEVLFCYEDDDTEDVLDNMAEQQIRRMPVVDREQQLVGIISIGDRDEQHPDQAGETLQEITEPGGEHSQSA